MFERYTRRADALHLICTITAKLPISPSDIRLNDTIARRFCLLKILASRFSEPE